jgi:putative glutathione S-transferase
VKALIEGVWHPRVEDRAAYDAARARQTPDLFRSWIGEDSRFTPQAGRYRLYVSYACPFAHRAILYRALLGLEDALPMTVAHPRWSGPDGWTFTPDLEFPEVGEDPVYGEASLWRFYQRAKPDFTGKVTVPVLWDTKHQTIVSTESAEIVRMLDLAMGKPFGNGRTFYPQEQRAEIDSLGGFIRSRINGGVYKVGFAKGQAAYDAALQELFAALDEIAARLADGRSFLMGETPCEADWLMFPTLVRFDAVYHGALRCSLRRLAEDPVLFAYTKRLYAWPGVAATVKLDHVKRHYYDDLDVIDHTIVPRGPADEFSSAA